MVMRAVGAAVLFVALAACAVKPVGQGQEPGPGTVSSGPTVPWQGHQLREVTSLASLPASIRQAVGADNPGLDGIVEKDQPFSSSDIVIGERPMRRFITAGQDGNLWLVVIEHGGIAPGVSATQVAGGEPTGRWNLPCPPEERPKTLENAVRLISASGPMTPLRRSVLPSS